MKAFQRPFKTVTQCFWLVFALVNAGFMVVYVNHNLDPTFPCVAMFGSLILAKLEDGRGR